jgi:DNA-binding GntR family transcriptional regulator
MSPEAAATDQAYSQLKADVMRGRYAPTSILNVHAIASELAMSISPIRDAMERLVGERLLAVRTGGGFLMPPMTSEIARELYSWHAYLARGAVHAGATPERFDDLVERVNEIDPEDTASLVQATVEVFELIGEMSGNSEHLLAIRAAGERLHPLRKQETHIKDRKPELIRLAVLAPRDTTALRDAIVAYHRRRFPLVSSLVSALYHPERRI